MRRLHGDRFEVASAGTIATRVRPEAIEAMAETGIDISRHRSKTIDEILGPNHALRNYGLRSCPGRRRLFIGPFPILAMTTFGEFAI